MDCDIENTCSQDLNCNVQHVVLSSSGLPAVTCPCIAPGEQARSPVRGEWLTWIMRVLKTTPELLEERHSNPWFALFLALCFPSMVAGMMLCVLGWGTNWHPFWSGILAVYTLNIFWAPFLLRFTEESIMKQLVTRTWCQTVMSVAIMCHIVGMMLAGTTQKFAAWLPFGDVSLTTLACYFQVPGMIISEHVLFVHNPRPTGPVVSVLAMYALLGTRLEEARADIVFGSRMVNSAQSGHCPYRGGISCLPHTLVAATIIVASAIDYITESIEVHALGSIAPHLPLHVKQLRANVIKMTCELTTAAAIVFFILSGMDEYSLIAATGETPTFQQAEMRRYAYMCIGTTVLAIIHVLLMMLVPDAAWARVQLRAEDAVRSIARRLSTMPGIPQPTSSARGAELAHVRLGQVVPVGGAPEGCVVVDDGGVAGEGGGTAGAADARCGEDNLQAFSGGSGQQLQVGDQKLVLDER